MQLIDTRFLFITVIFLCHQLIHAQGCCKDPNVPFISLNGRCFCGENAKRIDFCTQNYQINQHVQPDPDAVAICEKTINPIKDPRPLSSNGECCGNDDVRKLLIDTSNCYCGKEAERFEDCFAGRYILDDVGVKIVAICQEMTRSVPEPVESVTEPSRRLLARNSDNQTMIPVGHTKRKYNKIHS